MSEKTIPETQNDVKDENLEDIVYDDEQVSEDITPEETQEVSNEELALKAELDKANSELSRIKEAYIRASADFENIKKRFEREKQDAIIFGNEKLLKDLLPIIDTFEIAIKFEADDDFTKGIKEGMENTLSLFLKTLSKHGIEEINAEIGDEYNYQIHEAVSTMESELEPNKIVQVYQKGYSLNGRVIRACKVIVSK